MAGDSFRELFNQDNQIMEEFPISESMVLLFYTVPGPWKALGVDIFHRRKLACEMPGHIKKNPPRRIALERHTYIKGGSRTFFLGSRGFCSPLGAGFEAGALAAPLLDLAAGFLTGSVGWVPTGFIALSDDILLWYPVKELAQTLSTLILYWRYRRRRLKTND
ncbi:hypothetical protein SADUNF_Sadunf10G0098200 [Salix dunnii]|uniref:Uncharacterized protein n=1 Tax=Salix dunnii TaxID=1413687 RepID=A0A835JVM6_9ROSI|nr:hypothetical protein SADUNF_Sadunf10G0098200 [Salix dunnii]